MPLHLTSQILSKPKRTFVILSPYCFIGQIVSSYNSLWKNGPWFTFANAEIGGGSSFALLNKRFKIWCASTSSTGTRFLERCCPSPEIYIELTQRGPRECETRCLQFTVQRPGDLICLPHLLTHTVFTLDTASPTILSRWDTATTTNQQILIQTMDESIFGVRRGKWCEISRKKTFISIKRMGVFSRNRPSGK